MVELDQRDRLALIHCKVLVVVVRVLLVKTE